MSINLEAPTDGSDGAHRQRKPLEESLGGVVQMATIATHVTRCVESFERFLESVEEKEPECSDEITSSDVSDAIGRFRVWSSNIGARKTDRSSLEYRLRDASHIQERVQALLQSLNGFIEDGTAIVKGEKTAWDKLPPETHTNPNSTDDEPSDSSSDESLDNDTELRQLMTSIKTRITLLMRLSMAIRKPAAHDRLLASTDIDISHFQEYDIRHVREKFPTAPDYVVRRLGVAISKRRQYFKYRGAHARKLAYDPGIEESDGKAKYQLQSTIASSLPQALMSNRHAFDLDEDASSDARASQTFFAASTGHAAEGPRVPPLPRDAREGEPFECPFCFMLVSIRTRQTWKKHVYMDLHPYVCTYPGCHAAHKLFEGCREWFQHEREMHRRYWICQPCCSRRFQDRHDFREHIMNEHDITESVDDFIDDSEHVTGVETSANCCLCGDTCPSLLQLRDHLGDHQRQLALFALPMFGPEKYDEDDNADTEVDERSLNDSSVSSESLEDLDVGEDQPAVHPPSLSQDRSRPFIHQNSRSSEDDVPTNLRKVPSSPAHQSPRPESYALAKEFSLGDLNLGKQGYASPDSNEKEPMPERDERTHHDALARDKRELKIHDEVNKVEANLAGLSGNTRRAYVLDEEDSPDDLTFEQLERGQRLRTPEPKFFSPSKTRRQGTEQDCDDPDCRECLARPKLPPLKTGMNDEYSTYTPQSPRVPPSGYHNPSIETRIAGSTRPTYSRERSHSYYGGSGLSERYDYPQSVTSHGPPPSMYNHPQYATMMAPSPHPGYYGGLPSASRASDGFMPRPSAPSYQQAPVSDDSGDDEEEDEHGYYLNSADRDRIMMPQPAVEPSRRRPSWRSRATRGILQARSADPSRLDDRKEESVGKSPLLEAPLSRSAAAAGSGRTLYHSGKNNTVLQSFQPDQSGDLERERAAHLDLATTGRDASADDRRREKIHSDVNKVEAYLAGMNGNYSTVVDGLRTNPARGRASSNAVSIRTTEDAPSTSTRKTTRDGNVAIRFEGSDMFVEGDMGNKVLRVTTGEDGNQQITIADAKDREKYHSEGGRSSSGSRSDHDSARPRSDSRSAHDREIDLKRRGMRQRSGRYADEPYREYSRPERPFKPVLVQEKKHHGKQPAKSIHDDLGARPENSPTGREEMDMRPEEMENKHSTYEQRRTGREAGVEAVVKEYGLEFGSRLERRRPVILNTRHDPTITPLSQEEGQSSADRISKSDQSCDDTSG